LFFKNYVLLSQVISSEWKQIDYFLSVQVLEVISDYVHLHAPFLLLIGLIELAIVEQ
jgi:hypothetical protein